MDPVQDYWAQSQVITIDSMDKNTIKEVLDQAILDYAQPPHFIQYDPISIPHSYTRREDIEITAFWTAILSWGRRDTIIDKATDLFCRMDNSPYDFVMNATDLDVLSGFKHRTFQPEDARCFVGFFRSIYENQASLEHVFLSEKGLEMGINDFYDRFFKESWESPRSRKHVSCPAKNSACKRINMFLRWMVRRDGIDFGLWDRIEAKDLFIPLDVHVYNISRSLGLISREAKDWKTVLELTQKLRELDPLDPIKYDLALFTLGANKIINV